MSEYEPEGFDDVEPEPQQAPASEPVSVSREEWDALRYGVGQLAHYVAENLPGGQQAPPPEPPTVPELRLAVNPQTGAWEPVRDEPQPIDPVEAARQAALETIQPYEHMLAAQREQMTNQQIYSAFQAVKANGVEFDEQEAHEQAELLAATGQATTFADAIKGGIARSMMREQQRRQAWEAEQKEHLDKLASGRQEPGGGPAAPGTNVPTGADAYAKVQEDFFAARNLRAGGGT